MFKKLIGAVVLLGILIVAAIYLVSYIEYRNRGEGMVPQEGWWKATLHLAPSACSPFQNRPEIKVRFEFIREKRGLFRKARWLLKDEEGNVFNEYISETESAYYPMREKRDFFKNKEGHASLFHGDYCYTLEFEPHHQRQVQWFSRGKITQFFYFPDINEFKNLKNDFSCITVYSGDAIKE